MSEKQPVVTFNINLASLSLTNLAAVYEAADGISAIASGVALQPRCAAGPGPYGTTVLTPGGEFLDDPDNSFLDLRDDICTEAWRRPRDHAASRWEFDVQAKLALSVYLGDASFPEMGSRFLSGDVERVSDARSRPPEAGRNRAAPAGQVPHRGRPFHGAPPKSHCPANCRRLIPVAALG